MTNEGHKNNKMMVVLVAIMILNLLWIVFLAFVKQDGARAVETMKVGGKENMNMVKQLYTSDSYIAQQKTAIEQIVSQMWETVPTEETTPTEDTTVDATDTAGTLAIVEQAKKDWYFRGNKNARIMILEFSEMLCPYCQRQHANQVLEDVVEKYDGKVSAVFRHFIVHDAAKKISEAAECVWKVKWATAFYSFIDSAFTNIGKVDDAMMLSLAKTAGAWDISSCLTKGDFSATVDAQQTEGRTFGVTWTPGNVIIDTTTGKFVVVAGAYPIEKFVEEIDKLLAE